MQSKAGLLGRTWNRRSRGCPRHLWPLLLRLLPLFLLLLLLLLLDEAEVGAAEFGSGGRGDQARLQQHRGQAEEQGAGDAPAEPRHGREPAGHGGILRGCGRRRAPGLRNPAAPARSLPLAPSVVHSLGGRRRSGSAGGWRASGLGIPEHVTAGRGERGLPPPPPPAAATGQALHKVMLVPRCLARRRLTVETFSELEDLRILNLFRGSRKTWT